MSKTIYYLFPSVRVEDFRAHAGAYLVGVPQPTAVAGLTYALGLSLAKEHAFSDKPGVAYGVSDWSGFSGISLNQNQGARTKSGKHAVPAAIDDRVRASCTLALLIEFVFADDAPIPGAAEVGRKLEALRLQGGSLFIQDEPKRFDALEDVVRAVPRSAFFLVDAAGELASVLSDHASTWQALLSFIERPVDRDEYKPRWVPCLVGWRALETPVPRAEMRSGASAHAMAEPAIGLARFCSGASFRRMLRTPDPETGAVFWKHATLFHPQPLFVVKGDMPHVDDIHF